MQSDFFAYLSRMKYIARWSLMRATETENVQEHSHMTAVLAHALGLLRTEVFGGTCDPEHLAAIALLHDAAEIFTSDLPTPIKYRSAGLRRAYDEVEASAVARLLAELPEPLRPAYRRLFEAHADSAEYELVRAADKLSAYIKCVEERRAGNREFLTAEASTLRRLRDMALPEVDYFLEHFMPGFEKNLDELGTLD
jgi:5'-deoxynucleotidase